MANIPLFSLFFLFLLAIISSSAYGQETAQIVPAMYIFGDSTADVGNAVGHTPDFGKTVAEFVASFLGLPQVQPYKSVIDSANNETTKGINYAFAGVGILPETHSWLLENTTYWSFDHQIGLFKETVASYLPRLFTAEGLVEHLEKSIFLISFGINDYVWNYLPPANGTLSQLTPDVFAKLLMEALANRLTALYGLGARKMVINNIWPLGCTPGFTNPLDPTAICCNEAVNKLVRPYSEALPSILQNLQWNLTGVHFSVSNDFEFVAVVKKNPEKYGITNTVDPCYKNDTIRCDCPDQYLYWDWVHTTEAANHVFAVNCFSSTLCSPLNIIQLVGASIV